MKSLYVTIVNERYVLRALALYKSLLPHINNKYYVVYCVDDSAAKLLKNLKNDSLVVMTPNDFETSELLALKEKNELNAYCWMCKPAILEHALKCFPECDWAIYIDSDMMVFGDPDDGLPKTSDASVNLTPHRPSDHHFAEFIPTVGYYNAGYVGFRNTEVGRAALAWWKKRCLGYCPTAPEDGVYADQKYLEELSTNFTGVCDSMNFGLNTAPWNILGAQVSIRDKKVFINDDVLLLYHMQAFHIYGKHLFDVYKGSIKMPKNIRQLIYKPYENLLLISWEKLVLATPSFKQEADSSFWKVRIILRELKKLIFRISNLSIHV